MFDAQVKDRIKNYIDKIPSFSEGQRNSGLHNTGLKLRANFGLASSDLLAVLSAVNQTKCIPPLEDSEVQTIACQVDASNTPPAELQGYRKTQPPLHKGVSVLGYPLPKLQGSNLDLHPQAAKTARADAISAAVIRKKKISVYKNCLIKKPDNEKSIGYVLDAFRNGTKCDTLIDKIRSEPDKGKRDALKKQCPAVVFASEPQKERKAAAVYCKRYNGRGSRTKIERKPVWIFALC